MAMYRSKAVVCETHSELARTGVCLAPAASERFVPTLFKSVDEFQSRPHYMPELSCTTGELDRIVGKYCVPEGSQLQCGLNKCHRWHKYGYVIRTKDGRETHCGHDCGRRVFGVTWDDVEAAFQREERAQVQRKLLSELLEHKRELLEQATTLRSAVMATAASVESIIREVGKEPALHRALHAAVHNGGRIQVALKTERNLRKMMGASDNRADLETIGVIAGGACLSQYLTQEREIRFRVISPLESFEESELALLDLKEIEMKSKQIAEMRQTLQSAQRFLLEARRFCSKRNLSEFAKLKQIIPRSSHTARLDRILARL